MRDKEKDSKNSAGNLTENSGDTLRTNESEMQHLQHIFENAGWAIAVVEPKNNTFTSINPAFAKMHGYEKKEILGMPLADIFAPESRSELPEHIHAAETKGDYVYESVHIRKDGTTFPVETHVTAFKDETGEVLYRAATFLDIRKHRQTEENLIRSEEKYRTLFDSLDDGFCIIEVIFDENEQPFDYRFLEVNQAFEKHTGIENAVGKRMLEIAPQHEKYWFEIYGRIALTGEPARFENRAAQLHRWYEVHAFRFGEPEKRQVAVLFKDVTYRKNAEDSLRESEESYRILADTASDAIIRIDTESNIQFVNTAAERIFGYTPNEMIGQSLTMLMPEEMRERHRAGFSHYLDTGERNLNWESIEVPALHKDGHLFPLEISFGEYNEKGKQFFIGIARDVTERKRAEELLRESEEKFRTLADNMSQFAWMTDENGWIFWYNERWYEYTGTTLEEMQGWGWQAVHHPEEVDRVTQKFKQHIASGEIWEDTFPLRSKTGEYRWFLSRAIPIRDMEGKIVRWFGTNTDVEELRKAKIEAESANRLKDEFLATVSHELRTPLNAILGWATMARQSDYEPEVMRRAVEVIERNSRNQNQIISDILDVSRIITGKLNLEIKPVQLPSVINAAVDTVRPAIDAKQINLVTAIETGNDKKIYGDADRLQQIIWNLLSNAVKFTPDEGKIKLTLEYGKNKAEVTVADSGEGIAPEFLPFVFDRFRQADGRISRKHGGLGLGLAIVRHLVELHGGKVSVASEGEGQGATFKIDLPLKNKNIINNKSSVSAAPSENFPEASASPQYLLKGFNILVVDDEADALQLVAFILQAEGAEVFTAGSVDKALEILNKNSPDAIISDIGMPEKDGYFFINQIKDRQIPAIALTAYARKEDRSRTLQEGYKAYLSKPAEPAKLIKTILEITK